jgi:hypothetical protein
MHYKIPIYCSLMFDKTAIRHLEFCSTKYYDRVDFGNNLDSDFLDLAKQCLVFIAVSINEGWKLLTGYFLNISLRFTII